MCGQPCNHAHSRGRLRASAEARGASEQQYESEVRKYNGGHSTTYLVLDRQVALKNARGVELKVRWISTKPSVSSNVPPVELSNRSISL